MANLFDPFDPIGTVPRSPGDYSGELPEAGLTGDTPRDVLDEQPVQPLLWPFKAVLTVGFALLLVRLVNLQVVQGLSNRVLAEGNRIRTRSIEAPRGLILDREGRSLAKNQPSFAVELTPADLPRDAVRRKEVYDTLAPLVNRSADDLKTEVEAAGLFALEPITLMDAVDHDQALLFELKLNKVPGVAVAQRPLRQAETTASLSHVLGYVGKITSQEFSSHPNYSVTSQIGKSGIERSYDDQLRGEPGTSSTEVDSRGSVQRTTVTDPPKAGQNVLLGINKELQQVVADALKASLDESHASAGAAVGIDPRDGTIRFLVSFPEYDANQFNRPLTSADLAKLTSDPNAPLTNRVIAGFYPPGSTIKPLVASGGLADGVITKETSIDAPAEIRVGSFVFPDWKRHGVVNVTRAIAVSSDVFFYAVGGGWDKIRGLGIERLDYHLDRFGIGQVTGVDLPGEQSGLLPTPAWRKKVTKQGWYIGDTYHMSIGQGDLLVTPLQLASAIATIANGGTIWQPHVVEATVDPLTNVRTPIKPVETATDVEPADVLQTVRAGMREVVLDGTGRALNTLPLAIAGKTGTAQYGQPDSSGTLPTHAWFVSFAPYENPELAMVILSEGGGEGNEAAVPVAKTIYQWIIDHGFSGDVGRP